MMQYRFYRSVPCCFVLASCAGFDAIEESAPHGSIVLADTLADRAQIAGQYVATPAGGVTLASAAAMLDALDIPAAMNPTVLSITCPDPGAASVMSSFGTIRPTRGPSFLMLSTGRSGNGEINAEPGTDFAPQGPDGDAVTLRFQVTVPPGVNRLRFDYTFLSAEAPDFVGSPFNDTFTVRVSDALGANRVVATASVNTAVFHPASTTSVGLTPFLLFVDDPAGVDTVFDTGVEMDAGTTGLQRVDVPVAGGGPVIIELDIHDLGDGIVDSAVLVDNLSFSAVEVVDPHADMVDASGRVYRDGDSLVNRGQPVRAVAADGATQVVLRALVSGPGTAVFSVTSRSQADGSLSADVDDLHWSDLAVTNAVAVAGQYYVFALYRSPPDFNRGDDQSLPERQAALTMVYTPDDGPVVTQDFTIGIVRPPVIVVPDLWSSCLSWADHGSIMDPDPEGDPGDSVQHLFTVTCVDYGSTSSKGLHDRSNTAAITDRIEGALAQLREAGVAATRADVVGHGMGGLLARRYIDDPLYLRSDNFNAGTINRLITMNTPHLGARLADEVVTFRDFVKQVNPATWSNVKSAIPAIDPADGDVAIDEMMTTSPIINGLGGGGPRNVAYHAVVTGGGRNLTRAQSLALLPSIIKLLYLIMENNHPATVRLSPIQRQRLILGNQSLIFCNNAQATEADQHDLFATTWEQRGGLADQFTTQFVISPSNLRAGHFDVQHDLAHAMRLIELLDAPIGGGLFAPAMPSPADVPRINDCPLR